jgi:hypothetical protein
MNATWKLMHTLLLSYSATFLELKALLTYTSDPIALIVECFAAAKSNCVLMAERLTIFRNNYRSLKDFYLTPANLPSSERRKEDNNFTLTLGPHGATMTDITKSLKLGLQVFEKGVKILVNGIPTTVCAFTMAFTGDMPQQAANSGACRTMRRLGVGHVTARGIKNGICCTM